MSVIVLFRDVEVYKIYFNADEIYIFHDERFINFIQIRTEHKI